MSGFGEKPRGVRVFGVMGAALAVLLVAGCHHKKQVYTPPPPPLQRAPLPRPTPPPSQDEPYPAAPKNQKPLGRIAPTPAPPGGVDDGDLDYIATHEPIRSQVGLATWYRAPYKGRKAANGQVFDDLALTAAHRTLPMGSLIVVTNLKSGKSSAMRITDRGPFAKNVIVDMTEAAARATGVFPGIARVQVDIYRTPKPIDTGGRWCVQFGPLTSEDLAIALKARLIRNYTGATVIEFPGENSFWVRIRPEGDNREQSEYIARHVVPVEGAAYLTRLD